MTELNRSIAAKREELARLDDLIGEQIVMASTLNSTRSQIRLATLQLEEVRKQKRQEKASLHVILEEVRVQREKRWRSVNGIEHCKYNSKS